MSLLANDDRRRQLARLVRSWSVEDFHDRLAEAGVERAFVVFENGRFSLSHPSLLAEVQAFFELSRDFAQHEGVFIGRDPEIPTLFFAFVHDTRRGLAQGGLRYMPYPAIGDLFLDGLRLARGMTRKNALAGLWWGGGKGIVPRTRDLEADAWGTPGSPERTRLFQAYGRFIASLGGIYYTAEDVGTKTSDMNAILGTNRFVTCIGGDLGGSGNPSPYTARGVFRALQAGWRYLTGSDDLEGVRVAVQGVGNVGGPLVELLHEAGARIWATDLDRKALEEARERWGVEIVEGDAIYDLDVDVFAPCAIGAIVNARTIPRLRARLICGAANNILEHPDEDAERLQRRGIVYVPDYLCNRMGITNCCDEWAGSLPDDIRLAAERVYPDTLRVLKHARTQRITSAAAADQLADIAACELHPWMGHRGRRLIDRLFETGWHRSAEERPELEASPVAPAFDPGLDEPPMRTRWDRESRFNGTGPLLAAAPISTAGRPDLAALFSSLLLDVRARAVESHTGVRPRRALGSSPGGLSLQLAVERGLAWEREEVGRAAFVEDCLDLHRSHDAAIREQLHLLGAGFDPDTWVDPMSARGRATVHRLLATLRDAGLLRRERRLTWFDPSTQSALISPEVVREKVEVEEAFTVSFEAPSGEAIPTRTFAPEMLPGAAAVVVRPDGPWGHLVGEEVPHPLHGQPLPIHGAEISEDARFLVPAHDRSDHRLAEELGLDEFPTAVDPRGRCVLPGEEPLPLLKARRRIIEALGDRIVRHEGRWTVETWRARSSESLVFVGESEQLFVDLARAADHFRLAVESGAITFSSEHWKTRALDLTASLEPWCISRQYWWGHDLPDSDRGEVLSVWCSLVAWLLQTRGWPEEAAPEPVAELFADAELFTRWVLPAQLISLALTGRPAASHVRMHGVLHLTERELHPREDAPKTHHDEELFLLRSSREPMRRRLGNAVEPAALIRRFGADSLRLGLLLSLNPSSLEIATAEESHLIRARRTVRRLGAKVGGLGTRIAGTPDGTPRVTDVWIVNRLRTETAARLNDLATGSFSAAAHSFCELVDDLARWTATVVQRDPGRPGAPSAALRACVRALQRGFEPICPFVLTKLDRWTESRLRGDAEIENVPWLPELITTLSKRRDDEIRISTTDADARSLLEADLEELSQLCGPRIVLTDAPSDADDAVIGPVTVHVASAS